MNIIYFIILLVVFIFLGFLIYFSLTRNIKKKRYYVGIVCFFSLILIGFAYFFTTVYFKYQFPNYELLYIEQNTLESSIDNIKETINTKIEYLNSIESHPDATLDDIKKEIETLKETIETLNLTKTDNEKMKKTNQEKLNQLKKEYQTILANSKYIIRGFSAYKQHPNYPNGCETVALYSLLRFYNVNVSLDELMDNLKKGVGPYFENGILYGSDPETQFVGDPRDIHGYGVYQKPIIDLANQYKSGMKDISGSSLDQVIEKVKKGNPVQVWVSIDLKNTEVCTSWIDKQSGKTIYWICNLHSVVIVGGDKNSVIVADSTSGSIETYEKKQFEKMYNTFGKRAIYYAS